MYVVPEVIRAIDKELDSHSSQVFNLIDSGLGRWTIVYRVTRGEDKGLFTHYRTVTFDREGEVVGAREEEINGRGGLSTGIQALKDLEN